MFSEKKWAAYKQYLKEEELAEGTIQIYLRQAKNMLEELGEQRLTKNRLLAYKRKIEKSGLADSTINLYIIAINRYLKFINKEACVLKTRKIHRNRNLENVLSMQEYKLMLETAQKTGKQKYYYIMRTLASTGIRISELSFLTVEALENNCIYVRNKGKTREIYLPEQMKESLREYCTSIKIESGVIFRGSAGKAITREAVYKMLQKLALVCGIERKKVHPHSFRHLFAKTYIMHYGNLAELADILGHSSIETTRIYLTSTVEEKRSRMSQLGF